MSETDFLPFTDVFDDVTKDGTKIPTAQYLVQGKYPIIDQGQSYIAGYTNQEKGLFQDVPVIVFGDHTRALKYVDMPFFLGADGVKVLKPKIHCNVKYLYYVLQKQNIPDTGYNRHFKWLKLLTLPIIEPAKQDEIVCGFEKIEAMIARRKQQLKKSDLLIKAKFYEMFGTSDTPIIKVGNVLKTTSGGTPSKEHSEYYTNGNIPWLTSGEVARGFIYKIKNRITEQGLENSSAKWLPVNTVVIAMYGATAGQVGLLKIATTANQAVCGILPNKYFNPLYLYYAILQKKDWMISQCMGGAQPNISQSIIKKMEIMQPSLNDQNMFAHFVEQTEKIKTKIKLSLEKLELLKQSLLQKYFG